MSTGPISLTKSEQGILSEWIVARDRVDRCGEVLWAHREKTPFAEIDLLFEATASSRSFKDLPRFEREIDSSYLCLMEVKTVLGDLDGFRNLSIRQRGRLERARFYFQERYRRPVRLQLAVVDLRRRRIRYFDL